MHEQSIVESLLSLALNDAEKANARRIVSIKLIVGELTGVEKEAVNFYFGFLAKNTIAAGAFLDINYTKAQLRCRDCDIIFPRHELNYNCPKCRKKAIEIAPGYPDPYAYIGLLYREKIKVEPLKRDEFVHLNQEYNRKFAEFHKRKKRSEEYRKHLEEMGK